MASSIERVERPSSILELPKGVEARLEEGSLYMKGPLGEVRKDFTKIPVELKLLEEGKISLKAFRNRKRDKAILKTAEAIIRKLADGVLYGYRYKLKIVYSHFPITVKVKDDVVLIENFVGERGSRVAKIIGSCKVKVEGEDVIVEGVSVEEVGQTAANIEQATKIKRKDPRIFLDGIYLYSKERCVEA